jgi:hypothetical protein
VKAAVRAPGRDAERPLAALRALHVGRGHRERGRMEVSSR